MSKVNEQQIILPIQLIKQVAAKLGMVDAQEDEKVLAAIDDYFKTLNDGQYSPLSGENNNASNSTEVYHIAKKHGVDPAKLMKYLSDTAIFDKFQKLAVKEASRGFKGMLAKYESKLTKENWKPQDFEFIQQNTGDEEPEWNPSDAEMDFMATHDLDEKGKTKRDTKKPATTRNFVAKNARRTGAGSHRSKKDYTRTPKHKSTAFEGMPSQVIKQKQKLASMSPEELKSRFETLAARPDFQRKGMSPEDIAKAQERRHNVAPGTYSSWANQSFGSVLKQFEEIFSHAMKQNAVNEGKQRSVYEARLMKFLSQLGAEFRQGDDCVYVEERMIAVMGERFPEFDGMMKPLAEYKNTKPSGYNKDKYVTVADGDVQQYSGTDKGVG